MYDSIRIGHACKNDKFGEKIQALAEISEY